MVKLDLKNELKHLYRASAKNVVEVVVPPLKYLMIDGQGDPNISSEYVEAVEALFSVSYTAKFKVKKSQTAIDYAVMPLEGLWWADDLSVFLADAKAKWKWTMMILQPPVVTDDLLDDAVAEVKKKKRAFPGLAKLRFEAFAEGRCAQTMHVGPFSEERPTIERLHKFIDSRTGKTGKHHEIYLSDIRRGNPKNWKTIIRQPMK